MAELSAPEYLDLQKANYSFFDYHRHKNLKLKKTGNVQNVMDNSLSFSAIIFIKTSFYSV